MVPSGEGDSRQRIVEVLKRRGEASVGELSYALGLTPVTIRHHLEALTRDRIVAEPTARRKPGPGRPEMVYALTRRAESLTPRNYGELCASLLEAIRETPVDAEWLASSAGQILPRRSPPTVRRSGIPGAVEFLEARGYFPSVDQAGEIPVLILANCPYLEVARAFPQVCRFDLALIEALLGKPVVAETSIALNDTCCRIRLPSQAAN